MGKIKNFNDFVPNFRKILNHLFIVGMTKGGIFSRKPKEFELEVYYTPLKETIIEIRTDVLEIDKLPFKKGDDISLVRKWCSDNNYQIKIDRKKI